MADELLTASTDARPADILRGHSGCASAATSGLFFFLSCGCGTAASEEITGFFFFLSCGCRTAASEGATIGLFFFLSCGCGTAASEGAAVDSGLRHPDQDSSGLPLGEVCFFPLRPPKESPSRYGRVGGVGVRGTYGKYGEYGKYGKYVSRKYVSKYVSRKSYQYQSQYI